MSNEAKTTKCKRCGQCWPTDCEQAISVEMFGHCIFCSATNQQELHLDEIVNERIKRLSAKGISHDYILPIQTTP